jgi:hypothetical protein
LEREKRPWVIEIRNGMKKGEKDKSDRQDRKRWAGGDGVVVGTELARQVSDGDHGDMAYGSCLSLHTLGMSYGDFQSREWCLVKMCAACGAARKEHVRESEESAFAETGYYYFLDGERE